MGPEEPDLVIDADVLMNVIATGRAEEILAAVGGAMLCPQVESESLYLESPTPSGDRELIDLAPLIERGVLARATLTDAERDLYVELAAIVDDGEAQAIAVAIERRKTPATDDRRAAREARSRAGGPVGTPEIIRQWQEARRVPPAQVREATQQVERRAHFRPRRDHELASWWEDPASVADGG